jgi:hypothetical protein
LVSCTSLARRSNVLWYLRSKEFSKLSDDLTRKEIRTMPDKW